MFIWFQVTKDKQRLETEMEIARQSQELTNAEQRDSRSLELEVHHFVIMNVK